MSKRFYYDEFLEEIYDKQINDYPSNQSICGILNQQAQRIAELEEQLKKKPKYNICDRVYIINEDYEVERDFIESIDIDTDGIEYYTETYSICWYENQLFATEAEAQAKLEELGEKK